MGHVILNTSSGRKFIAHRLTLDRINVCNKCEVYSWPVPKQDYDHKFKWVMCLWCPLWECFVIRKLILAIINLPDKVKFENSSFIRSTDRKSDPKFTNLQITTRLR